METVLITGGSGLIGKHLTSMLLNEGFEVIHLSRKKNSTQGIRVFEWNPEKNFIDTKALNEADHIIHLAGATVAKYWTASYKKKLINSRVKTARLLFDYLSQNQNKVKSFISSSAVGYYGNREEQRLEEQEKPGNDFLSEICLRWEEAAREFKELNKRVTIIRTGIVLAREGGTLPSLNKSLRFGIAPIFGSGNQYYPWIHIHDVCRIYHFALSNSSVSGAFNAVAPDPARFRDLMNSIGEAAGKRKLNFPVPSIVLKIILDGFGYSLLNSLRCSSQKIEDAGFRFRYPQLKDALRDLL